MSELEEMLKQQEKETKKEIDLYKTVYFQKDTVPDLRAADGMAGGYIPKYNSILMMHFEDEKVQKQISKDLDVFLQHETQHYLNAQKGCGSSNPNNNVDYEQFYKLCMADEISANMAELIYLREEYIKTKDISLFDKRDGNFTFYKEAIQKGEIDPLSSDPEKFEKDMSLIMNGTQKMWMEKYAPFYASNHTFVTCCYALNNGKDMTSNNKEYSKQLDLMYTLGGINFNKYNNQDNFELPKVAKEFFEKEPDELTKDELLFLSAAKEDTESLKRGENVVHFGWNPDRRVSKVLEEKVLDMDKEIITKPQEKIQQTDTVSNKTTALKRLQELRGLSSSGNEQNIKPGTRAINYNNEMLRKYATLRGR